MFAIETTRLTKYYGKDRVAIIGAALLCVLLTYRIYRRKDIYT